MGKVFSGNQLATRKGEPEIDLTVEIPALVRAQMNANWKMIPVLEYEVANAVEATGKYRMEWSESTRVFQLWRRER